MSASNPKPPTRIVFDMSNPKDAAKIKNAIERLKTRTLDKLISLHYLETPEGWHCLDLGLVCGNRESLDLAVRAAIRAGYGEAILPAAPLDLWMRMVRAGFVGQTGLRRVAGPRPSLMISIASEVR